MGGSFAHRWTQTQEARHPNEGPLWTQEEAEYHGKYYNFPPSARSRKPAGHIHLLSWVDYIPPGIPTHRGMGRCLDACRGQPGRR